MNDLQVVEQELSDAIMREMRQAMQTKNISLTLLADMSGSKTFNWTVDHLFQVGPGSLDGANISKPSGTETAYTTSTKDFIFRLDIKDTYGAGVEALAKAKKSNFTTSGFLSLKQI